MTSHLGLMILFAICVSVVFGTLLRDEVREQVRFAVRLGVTLVVAAIAVGWLMHFAF